MPHAIQIYELRCPGCMHELNGVSSDKLFICASCGDVYCATEGRLKKEPLFIADTASPGAPAVPDGDRLFFLPFWRFEVAVHVKDASQNDITADTGADGLRAVWVPAFFEVRPNIFGNPGMTLTVARVSPVPTLWPAEQQMLLPGGARRAEEAADYVKPFVSGTLDRERDISGYDISVTSSSGAYWAIPFGYSPSEMVLKDLLCGATYPANMVERIDEIVMFQNGIR